MGKKKPKVEPDAAASHEAATAAGAVTRKRRNKSKKTGEPAAKPTRRPIPSSRFDGTCYGLKGRGIVFDSADPRADRFTQVKREIVEHIGKE
mmetsp:Transcript_53098/g.158901  ORF Transcript_53098/g.158901 Transcript_53098/m.158901 type:complete len:92 (-) Transcript_53098:1615-1890(-)